MARTSEETEKKLLDIVKARRKKVIHAASVSKTSVVADLVNKAWTKEVGK